MIQEPGNKNEDGNQNPFFSLITEKNQNQQ